MRLIERWERFYETQSVPARITATILGIAIVIAAICVLVLAVDAADWLTDQLDPSSRSDLERCLEEGGSWCADLER